MKSRDAIVLIVCLITVFALLFAWCWYKAATRAVTAEVHEMRYRKDVEAAAAAAAAS